jgi:rhodanese-related sulfurtransferase
MTSPVRRLAAVALIVVALAACGGSAATAAPAATAETGGGAGAAAPAALPAEVDVAKAKELQAAGAFVLDVREPSEWVEGHIDGATLIPLGELPNRVAEVPADKQIVVVCRSGNRSQAGRDVLLGAGLPSVTSMAGGVKDWGAAGYPLVTGQ